MVFVDWTLLECPWSEVRSCDYYLLLQTLILPHFPPSTSHSLADMCGPGSSLKVWITWKSVASTQKPTSCWNRFSPKVCMGWGAEEDGGTDSHSTWISTWRIKPRSVEAIVSVVWLHGNCYISVHLSINPAYPEPTYNSACITTNSAYPAPLVHPAYMYVWHSVLREPMAN